MAETSISMPLPSQDTTDGSHNSNGAVAPPGMSLLGHAAAFWRSCLASGLRVALACIVVGVVSVYGPAALRRHLTFPAFSYVVTVIVVTDATLGGTLRGAVSALYATMIGAVPSVLALWLVHLTGVSVAAQTAVVTLAAFAVALPGSAGPMAKRIALGQIVIIYVANFRQGDHPGHAYAILHPARVVACTALGVVAAILAVLLPCPKLASHEVTEKSKVYGEMAIERLRVLVEAFCADNKWCMAAYLSQANCFTSATTTLLHNTHSLKEDSKWERLPLKFLQRQRGRTSMPLEKMRDVEMALKGMEMALNAAPKQHALPIFKHLSDQIGSNLSHLRNQISLTLLGQYHLTKGKNHQVAIVGDCDMPQSYKDLAPFFFLFSMKLLHHGALALALPATLANAGQDKNVKVIPAAETSMDTSEGEEEELQEVQEVKTTPIAKDDSYICLSNMTRERLVAAFKCAFSLGLAVLLGLLFSNENGFWSGLIVATTMSLRRESTWTLATERAHGTALGSVYSVLGCLISQHLMELRFLALLPCIVVAAFLRRSRAYGPAGGTAVVLSVIIIMGRRGYGPVMAFTIMRMVETFIGLSCTILSDLLFQPTRASTLARAQVARSLGALRQCMATSAAPSDTIRQHKSVQEQVSLLHKHTAEARGESNLWFLPFPNACYEKLHGSLAKMAQLVYFQARAMETMMELCDRMGVPWEEVQEEVNADMEQLKRLVSSSLQCLEEIVARVGSLARLNRELSGDLEASKRVVGCSEEAEAAVGSFLGHAREATESVEGELKGEMVACMASVGFCMGGLAEAAGELEAAAAALVQWENPGWCVDLNEIWCKIRAASERLAD